MRQFKRPSVRLCRSNVLFGLILLGAISVGMLTLPAAQFQEPRASDRQVTLVVKALLKRDHMSKHPLDDEISQRGLASFLKMLDPMKVYFYQSDVDEFMARRDEIDDAIEKGDIGFGYTVFNRFLERVDERVKMIDELLTQAPDFAMDEEMVTDRDLLRFAKDAAEARERWRTRIKYDLLVLKGDKTEGQEAIDKLQRRYHTFARRMHQTDSDELLEMYLTSVTSSYDPHTTYMSPSSLTNFRILMGLSLEGIGAKLQDMDGQTTVTEVIPGGAADKHGKLKPEDRIVSVGQGGDGPMVDVVDMKLNDVVKLIRGKAGTTVRLGVIPAGDTETKIYNITRATIELKDSEARGQIIEEGKKPDGSPLKIGVIDLPSFYMDMEGARRGIADFKSTTRDVRVILDDFTAKNVDAVVLDLRRNGGGSLTEAINLTGLFIDQGPVVQVKDPDGTVQHYDDLERGMAWKGPLVVLTSKFSASASEILAGAIQDYHRGLVIGDDSTHGKGTVQSLLDVGSQLFQIANPPNLGALKITMQQFYRPNGDSTQKRGVLSDLVLPSLTNHIKNISEADLDYALEFDRVPAVRYSNYNMVSPELLTTLRTNSTARTSASEDFAKLARNIERYKEQRDRKTVTLNEEKYFAQRAELDADKEDEKQFEEQNGASHEVFRRNYYNNEVLAITLDYLKALENHKIAQAN